MTTLNQSDASFTSAIVCSISVSEDKLIMSAGATLGTLSRSSTIATNVARTSGGCFFTAAGDPGTNTWIGACVMRWNITTANTNVTWGELVLCENNSVTAQATVTITSGLAIGLGTTGVKTASVEITTAYTTINGSASAELSLHMICSNAGTMAASFNWLANQTVTLPMTTSAAPAATVFTLAQLGAGL